MGEIRLPRHMFLWSVSVVYLFAFASLYVQVPGLYGNEGILPARWHLQSQRKELVQQLQDMPTLLWFGPHLGLDTQQAMELLCLLGVLLAFGAVLLESLRDSVVFFCLWALYLSLYQVGQVFLYFQWDSLLLETGFLTVLVAPLNLFRQKSSSKYHDSITFWLVRWLLFRLMFSSGVVKLTSQCPTWWDLTALTHHYETQCIPTSLAWYAHQLPTWFQKLSVVGTFVIEIAVPFLFFAPIRGLRVTAFYLQVVLQLFIILTGNYNFFNLITIILCFSLLDDEQVGSWLGHGKKKKTKGWTQTLGSWAVLAIEVAVYAIILYWTKLYFQLEVNWQKKTISSKTAFNHLEFNRFLKMVTVPSIWIGVFSLTWEVVTAMFKCACVRGIFWKFWATLQWAIFATSAASMFALSVVPYTNIEYDAHSNIWPGVRQAYGALHRYQLVNSYGLFRRMTGVGGRPEVVIEGSMDKHLWMEIEFMYKPGNVSASPPVVAPHQPRLDWQMWFAALGPHSQSPWFSSLMQRLLEGKRDVTTLVQADKSRYPFSQKPPTFIRASLYKYRFTAVAEDGTQPQRWWRREYIEEFYPTVSLGDPVLESFLKKFGLKDEHPAPKSPGGPLPQTLQMLRGYIRNLPGPLVLWSLFCGAAAICLLKHSFSGAPRASKAKGVPAESRGRKGATAGGVEKAKKREEPMGRNSEKPIDSDRSPRKRK